MTDRQVFAHQLASQRRAAGKPAWDRKIRLGHVWKNPDLTFEQRRDAIVSIIRATSWHKQAERENDRLVEVVYCLSTADDVDEWDEWWDEFYDIADADRVWIDTVSGDR